MNLEPLEIVEYIETSNNLMEAQANKIEELEKQSSEKDARIQELESELTKVPQSNEEKVASDTGWGSGEKQENNQNGIMRESERFLMERFGIPIN